MTNVLGMVKDHVKKWNPKFGGEAIDEILFNEKWFFFPPFHWPSSWDVFFFLPITNILS
jgi:hypothetical protein